jgi:hypothetical protein
MRSSFSASTTKSCTSDGLGTVQFDLRQPRSCGCVGWAVAIVGRKYTVPFLVLLGPGQLLLNAGQEFLAPLPIRRPSGSVIVELKFRPFDLKVCAPSGHDSGNDAANGPKLFSHFAILPYCRRADGTQEDLSDASVLPVPPGPVSARNTLARATPGPLAGGEGSLPAKGAHPLRCSDPDAPYPWSGSQIGHCHSSSSGSKGGVVR